MDEKPTPKTYGRIVFPGYENNVIENPDDIASVFACSNYSVVTFKKNKYRDPMKHAVCLCFVEDRLDPKKHNRCNDNYIVTGNYIETIRKHKKGLILTLFNGEEIPVSVRKKDQFVIFIKDYFPDLEKFLN
jgi:DNA-binding LytR/AlgR family response regulator